MDNEQATEVGENFASEEYNKLVEDEGRLKTSVYIQACAMVNRGILPTWEAFTKTAVWAVLANNLTDTNQKIYEDCWEEFIVELNKESRGDS